MHLSIQVSLDILTNLCIIITVVNVWLHKSIFADPTFLKEDWFFVTQDHKLTFATILPFAAVNKSKGA